MAFSKATFNLYTIFIIPINFTLTLEILYQRSDTKELIFFLIYGR